MSPLDSIAFLCGALLLQLFSHLTQFKWIVAIIFFYLIYLLFAKKNFFNVLLLWFFCGLLWIWWAANSQTNATIKSDLEGKLILVTGYIASIPDVALDHTSFLFSTEEINKQKEKKLIKLSSRDPQLKFHVGDKWQLTVRLKKIVGNANPGGFDYEAWAFQEGLNAQGYVLSANNIFISRHWYHYAIAQLREYLLLKTNALLPPSKTSRWIPALIVGVRQGIDYSDWQVLRNTGTNHLMAIAGLHIGCMAAFMHFFIGWLWRKSSVLPLKIPAQHAGALAALLIAFVYSLLAGFSIPTQRACLMLVIFIVALLFKRKISSWYAWSLALLSVLILNPLTILSESFWLSFGSVALIIFGVSGRLAPKGLWWKWGRIQWIIAVGLIPLSICLFNQCALVAFIANAIAIPVVGFIVVPCSLLGALLMLFSDNLSAIVLHFADLILTALWYVLTWLAYLPNVVWYQSSGSSWILFSAIIAIVLILAPIGLPGRFFSVIWLLPIILFKPEQPKAGEIWFSLLDVGQGLASVVQTQKHILVFDTGGRLSASHDMGESVVVPFLHRIGAQQIDMLVISHGDNDHIGGAKALLKNFPVKNIFTSVPEKFSTASLCLQGLHWTWDGVNFEFLYPNKEALNLNNDSSCVLRVTDSTHQLLLTGDIEKFAEEELLKNNFAKLSSTILIAPHHGSKTSGLPEFLNAVRPNYVLFPVGYRNRYHFPNPVVQERYLKLNSLQLRTDQMGAIQIFLSRDNVKVESYRVMHGHYWNNYFGRLAPGNSSINS